MGIISRHWKGIVKPEEGDNYLHHLRHETFPKLSQIEGFLGASILRRTTTRGIEFLIVTKWQSMAAIREFAGEAAHMAVVPQVAQAMMVEYDQEVTHYELVEERAR